MVNDNLKFPIGTFQKPKLITPEIRKRWIGDIKTFPKRLEKEVKDLSENQLNTPYRVGGWSIRQVVHHCTDSHMNSFIRFKLALSEDSPTIKSYFEDRWAEYPDTKEMSIEPSLLILNGLHKRWVVLLESMDQKDFEREFIHPEHKKSIRLDENLGMYAWHCNHHLAHITQCKKQNNW